MTLLLDHCVPRRYQRILREWGYVCTLVTDYIAADATDLEVIALAQKLDAVLVTIDLDFANILNYPPGNYNGIIVIRHNAGDEAELDKTLWQALTDLYQDELRGTLIVIAPYRYRLRR
jgi:predicted nuclease of predicted toxin-antitoxin system